VLRLRAPRRLYLRWADRVLLVWLYRRFPRILDAITIVRPETVVRWHRMGFDAYWRRVLAWKSRALGGRLSLTISPRSKGRSSVAQANGSVFARPLVPIAFAVVFLGFVVANGTPERRTGETVMTCVVAGGSADNSSLKAASRICGVSHRCQEKG
jgi:hypothetical protein